MRFCTRCGQALVFGADKRAGEHAACPVPQASPVEGPMGDPEHGGSPPADAPPVDQRADTVPAPPPPADTAEMESPPCSRS